MNSEVYIKASELAKAIAQSPEAELIRKTEQEIRKDKVANNLTERWKKVYERVSEVQSSGQELTEQDEKAIEFIEAKVENHPLILEFIEAHGKFAEMLEGVNGILSGALTFDTEEQTDACVTCPSKAQCGSDPNPNSCS
ncbi:MAG: hypothetical protein APF84_03515 [Gracilibacter sp. BRH_c7a]|nr:MAG: hypothetical protein APF84_03515 [Gracilibacter sp. BRH_c7a]